MRPHLLFSPLQLGGEVFCPYNVAEEVVHTTFTENVEAVSDKLWNSSRPELLQCDIDRLGLVDVCDEPLPSA